MASIDKRSEGYRIRVSRGTDHGKRLKPYSKTWTPPQGMSEKKAWAEVNRIAALFEAECKAGRVSIDQNIKFRDFAMKYLSALQGNLAPRTIAKYEQLITQVFVPLIGNIKITDLKPAHMQEVINALGKRKGKTGKPVAASTVIRDYNCMRSIMHHAIKMGLIHDNPSSTDRVQLPKSKKPLTDCYSKAEVQHMLEALQDAPLQFQVAITLALYTGARLGELIGLKFSDIDYNESTVSIRRTAYAQQGAGMQTKQPKDNEERQVAIPKAVAELVQQLEHEKKQQAAELGTAWHADGWLLTQYNGEMMYISTLPHQFKSFLAEHQLRVLKFHALRHTAATLMLSSKAADLFMVQRRLGHASITTTRQYLHALNGADTKAVNGFADWLNGTDA